MLESGEWRHISGLILRQNFKEDFQFDFIWITGEEGGLRSEEWGVLWRLERRIFSVSSGLSRISIAFNNELRSQGPGRAGPSLTYSWWELSSIWVSRVSRGHKPLKTSIVSNLLVICFLVSEHNIEIYKCCIVSLQAKQYWPHYKRLLLKCSMF